MDADISFLSLTPRGVPLVLPWPSPGLPGGFMQFETGESWRGFVMDLAIDPLIPLIVQAKFARAQKLYVLAWLENDLIKAGELAALVALELALNDRYGQRFGKPGKRKNFADLLKYMVVGDGLSDAAIPMIVRCGGTAVGLLLGERKPSLAAIRNGMAHGDPFDALPYGGLLELVRDLIGYAYRDYIAEGCATGTPSMTSLGAT
ncbi:hypothetical protein D0Z70_14525 [Sphingobium terrigena]|uniref:Uncharacterized protein n=1 Tax=Sphingobium terrigena TaxID=2304063 RepID=A0A418YR00_9SPHN|nr:hypothetical protein [Sphingobium terrigena]RJG53980.1 hypothetical protein D0Z70_14525 [Sphingobium terrigena]